MNKICNCEDAHQERKECPVFEINRITCGDAIAELKKLPDESIDLVLTDIPYGETGNDWVELLGSKLPRF